MLPFCPYMRSYEPLKVTFGRSFAESGGTSGLWLSVVGQVKQCLRRGVAGESKVSLTSYARVDLTRLLLAQQRIAENDRIFACLGRIYDPGGGHGFDTPVKKTCAVIIPDARAKRARAIVQGKGSRCQGRLTGKAKSKDAGESDA